jgi:colanic acid/amylovoran biosynthesis glycosyltransferase
LSRYILHTITSHVSNYYMYHQIVGVKGYKHVVHGGYVIDSLPFERFFPRTEEISDFRKIIKKYPIELIHAHFGSLGAKACKFAEEFNLPLVTHFRGGDGSNALEVRDKWIKKYNKLIKLGSLFVPVCQALVPMLIDIGFPNDRIKVLYGGINLDDFPFIDRDFNTLEKWRICFVGKTSPKKGLPTLFHAFVELCRHFENLELYIISSAPNSRVDQEEYKKLLHFIDQNNLQHKIFFRFDVDNKKLHKILHQAHLFCHPSCTFNGNIEGIPNALKEAMATGLPCVSTYHAGIPELIQDGYNGLLAPENDSSALCEALARLITNAELCKSFAVLGRRTVEHQFDLTKQLIVQKRLYNSLFEKGSVVYD